MIKNTRRLALLLAIPLMSGIAACGGDDEREALRADEMDRQLELALQDDSTNVRVIADAPTPKPVDREPQPDAKAPPRPTPKPTPRATPPRDPAPVPTPRPRQPDPAPAPRAVTVSAPSGTTMAVTMNETLSTERNRVGDTFSATLQDAVRGSNGEIVIPAGATIRGRLTQVDKSGHVGATGVIAMAFESVSFGGKSYPLDATVVRANPERKNRTTATQHATKIGAGAAAGAILGRVIGKDTRSTIKGAVIGAAAGTAIAMGTADVDVVLPAGSEMVIRLDSPVEVRRVI